MRVSAPRPLYNVTRLRFMVLDMGIGAKTSKSQMISVLIGGENLRGHDGRSARGGVTITCERRRKTMETMLV